MFYLTHPIFNDENAAREHLEALNWPDGPVFPHCGCMQVAKVEGKRRSHCPGLNYCNDCKGQFTEAGHAIAEVAALSALAQPAQSVSFRPESSRKVRVAMQITI